MENPKAFWNQRYAEPGWGYGTDPNDFVREHWKQLTSPVLCLGEGEGRNAVYLAQQGLEVTALDLSQVALEKAQKLAAERGVKLATVEADLDTYDLGVGRWGSIIAVWCHLPTALRAKVHPGVVKALKPGGVFLLECYTPRQVALGTGGPKDVDMLYEPEDLRRDFAGLELLHLEESEREVHEGKWHEGKSAVVQLLARKP